MNSAQLPGGGRAWFVRYRKRRGCGMRPASIEGRLLTGFYALWISSVTWFMMYLDPGTPGLIAWIALIVASTFLYIVTALRMSAPASGSRKGGC